MLEVQFARQFAAVAKALVLSAALAGCGGGGAATGGDTALIETATVEGARRSIDPAYAVPAENRAATEDAPMTEFHRRAAEIAIREKKVYGAAAHLAALYQENPGDKRIAFELARHLRYVGALIEAEGVLNDALAIHGADPVLKLEQAKLFLAGGRAAEAEPILDALMQSQPDDPAILQAAGLTQDRLQRHDKAQEYYRQAMALGRPTAALLNNAGLSHLISGDLDGAIALFRQGAAAPGATPQTRMNLAMALALKGEKGEAERLAAGAAPSEIAAGAVKYYSSIGRPAGDAWSIAAGG